MKMNWPALLLIAALCSGLAACTQHQRSPEEVRKKTAEATATLKADARAVAEGVKEGWSRDRPLDLNHASKEQIESLPGVSGPAADRIVANRPYRDRVDLVKRRIVSQAEYDRISDRVTAK